MSRFVGVILAGGYGRRMGALGQAYAKALLPIGNEPVAVHHLRLLAGLGARHVYVVVGHRADDVMSALGDGASYGITITYVSQGTPLGSAHALGRLRPHVREPILVILGDYYFVPNEPERLVRRLHAGEAAIAAKRERDPHRVAEACALSADRAGRVLAIVEKPLVPNTDLKGCGFYAFQPEIFDAVARTPRTALRDEYELTVAIEQYVAAGYALYAEEVVASDTNLTGPEDVLDCNLEWLRRVGRNSVVAEDAQLDTATQLERALVGRRARVEGVSTLRDVVVFAGASLRGTGTVQHALVTTAGCIPCAAGGNTERHELAASSPTIPSP